MQCPNHNDREATYACSYCGKLFCEDCLVDLDGKKYCKEHLKNAFDEAKKSNSYASDNVKSSNLTDSNETNHKCVQSNSSIPNIIINNENGFMGVKKSKMTALLLCIFLGWLGAHRFYTGKAFTGILYLFTLGFYGVGIVIDLVLIITGAFRDKSGFPLT